MEFVTILGNPYPVYGLCILAGIILAALTILVRSRRGEWEKHYIAFLCALAGLLVGSKLLYLVTIADRLWEHRAELLRPEMIKSLLVGGFVFYGGLIGAIAAIAIYCRAARLRFLTTLDALIPCAAIAQAAGRVGCRIVGCCHGIPWDGPFAVTYPEGLHAPAGIPLFPVQLAESAALVVIYIVLMLTGRRREGFSSGLYLICSAVTRFLLEFVRGDAERGTLCGLATSQWIALIMLPVGIALLVRSVRKGRKEV